MTYLDVIEELRKKPFEPFRLFVSDGTVYDIRHPEQCMVGLASVVVGVSGAGGIEPYQRMIRIGCDHIVRIEPLQTQPASGDGQLPA